ncbi:MAG: type I DNA topoisomerase [Candidatus Krumholzibacteriota bacterium]|nr:type I DNA topoisomerase [Candidatus Krumholzibacteriota bacterium]
MSLALVVVESPAKARTIKKYLGKGYKVRASVGHIRDLPKRELGIDVEDDFKPKYVNVRGKSKIIKELKSELARSSRVLLATDNDREGEAIAWHLEEILKQPGTEIKRITFNEITKNALLTAVQDPQDINMNKVNAQQARRILDRLVGYMVSPVLWKIFYRGLSAGRVQSVGLRLLCEREEEIRNFLPQEYWTIEGTLANSRGSEFPVKLFKIKDEKPELKDRASAERALAEIKSQELSVSEARDKERKRNPQPPFITSTLQREAAGRLGFSAKKTMLVAQQLYEGVMLGDEGSVGLISYMRTDSTRISDEAFRQGIKFIEQTWGKDTLYPGKRSYGKKKLAQDAHEAVRPTNCILTPEAVRQYLNPDQEKLYRLIWQRFLASLAAAAVYQIQEVDISAGKDYLLRANGRKLKEKGFLSIFPDKKAEAESWLPDLSPGEVLSPIDLDALQHYTEPPARFSEASLIKELEEKGIGRPSTYASIISIIQTRDYAQKEGKALYPTELGEIVWKLLEELFQDIFEVDFTARMESELDKIEESAEKWQDVVRFFYEPLAVDLEKFNGRQKELKKLVQEETEELCENCGRRLVKKWSRNGPFLACPAFPDCKYSRSLEADETIDRDCPRCGGKLAYRNGRFGKFIACGNYPECKYTEAVTLGIKCPQEGCDGEITEKRTRRGKIFYGCSEYPKCQYASWDKPTDKKCPQCGKSPLVEKVTKKRGHFLKCPSCKYEVDS